MTGYGLGVDLGTTHTAAAVRRGDRVEVLRLGGRRSEIPSVVFVPADGPALVGEPAARRGQEQPGRLVREVKRRLGDPVPILVGGSPFSAHALLARQLAHVLTVAATSEQGPPSVVVLTCPANWGPYKRDLLEQAARLADAPAVVLRTEPEAAAIEYAAGEHMAPGDVVAVYDLGGGTFDTAVLRRTATGFDLLGTPEGIEHLGGADFDEAVFAHVTGMLPADHLTGDDPATVTALAQLRAECVEAKEALSFDTETSIPVALPGLHTRVRLTRRELEAMIAPALEDTVNALRRALRSAEVRPEHLKAVLLSGGSSRIPLVAAMVSEATQRPVVVDPHPEHSIALGAARLTTPLPTADPTTPLPTADLTPPLPTAGVGVTTPLPTADSTTPLPTAGVTTPLPAADSTTPLPVVSPLQSPPPGTAPFTPLGENRRTPEIPEMSPGTAEGRSGEPTPGGRGAEEPTVPTPLPRTTRPLAPPDISDMRPAPEAPAGPGRRTRVLVGALAVVVVAVAVPITLRLLGNKPGGTDAAATPPPSASAASAASAASSVAAVAPACGFADEFDAAALDPAWSRTRTDTRLTLAGGAADLEAPEGSDIYTGFMTAPRLLRPVTGDFVLEATLDASPAVFYQAAGLLLWVGPDSYVRVERGFGGTYGTLAFEYRDGGTHQRVHGPLPGQKPVRADATRVVLRMTRTAGTIAAAWRPADRAAFTDLGRAKLTLPATVSVGVSVLNRAQFGAKPTPFHARVERIAVSC